MENKMIVAVKGVVLYEGKMLILQRSDSDDIGSGIWELPGGKLEFGEELYDGLKRELLEETGILIHVERLLYATTFQTHEWRQVVILTYLCSAGSGNTVLSGEHQNYMWVTAGDARRFLSAAILADFEKNAVFEKIGLE